MPGVLALVDDLVMLAYEDEPGRKVFAVYVRPEGERGEINFYPSEAAATADVGPGMPEGFITRGETYVEYIGDALLFAPADWPLISVNLDLLVQLEADDFEIFVALTPSESDALILLASEGGEAAEEGGVLVAEDVELEPEDAEELVEAPAGVTGTRPCGVWLADGELVVFASGADAGGRAVAVVSPRADFGDEIGTDRGVVALLDHGWVPLVDDTHTWREVDDAWVIHIQQRVADDNEQFFGRYSAADESLVVTRAGADTDNADEHLQLIAEDVACDFAMLGEYLGDAGWVIDLEGKDAAELSVHPELSESPGWYPAESDDGIEWVCAVERASTPASSRA